MDVSLLQTKLYIPLSQADRVPRSRLLARLDQRRRLTLVSAPAGFGKTTLLAAWASERAALSPPFERVAWLSLDADDDDPGRFWTYVIAALQAALQAPLHAAPQATQPPIGQASLAMLRAPQPPPAETVLTELINEVVALADPLALVLDDYHLITSRAIQEAMAFLLDHLPPHMRLILLTRADPPLPLARLRGRGQLVELRAADLRFTADEAAAFLTQVMGLELPAADLDALDARTEGWIAGLQLAALSMQGRADLTGFVTALTGGHHYIVDYLVQEVLDRQADEVRAFLLQTSILDRLCGPLCDALTGRTDGEETLEALERGNLFLVPLDDLRRWYRYHHLFADMLRSRLAHATPNRVGELHRRASAWHEGAKSVELAIEHSLAAGDYARVQRLLRRFYPEWMRPENRALVQRWFESLPRETLEADPWLCVVWAWIVWGRGLADEAERALDCAQRAYDRLRSAGQLPQGDPEYDSLPAEILSFRGLILTRQDAPRQVIDLAERALALAPKNAFTIQAIAYLDQQVAYRDLGQMEAAIQACRLGVSTSRDGEDVGTRVSALYSLGLNLILLGRLGEAAQVYWDGLRHAERRGEARSPRYDAIYVRLAELAYEKDDLAEADRLLEQGLEIGEQGTYLWHAVYGRMLLSRLRLAQGDHEAALDALGQVERLLERIRGAYFYDELAGYAARLGAELGQRERAASWAGRVHPSLDQRSGYRQIDGAMQRAHVLVALGRLDEGLEWAARVHAAAQARNYIHVQIAMGVLQAVACHVQDRPAQALQALQSALSLAEPEGYLRTFLDHGLPLLDLLRAARQRGIAPAYAARLLGAAQSEPPPAAAQPLIEPLSERELEVLRLLAEGKTNREIGGALFIAIGTVKKHLSNIFGKLGTQNRTECVARARELGLI